MIFGVFRESKDLKIESKNFLESKWKRRRKGLEIGRGWNSLRINRDLGGSRAKWMEREID